MRAQRAACGMQIAHLVDLGQHDGVGPGGFAHVGGIPGRVRAIDAHRADGAGGRPAVERFCNAGAGLVLFVRTHGVFQIEDQEIGADMGRLLDGAGLGGGNEEGGADQSAHSGSGWGFSSWENRI